MNKTKKGFLTASSILTIVGSSLLILISLFCFLCSGFVTEDLVLESYKSDPEYTYYENGDEYFFTYEEDGVLCFVYEDEINLVTNIVKTMFIVGGTIGLLFSLAKLILSILILVKKGKNKYSPGLTISLLILSILTFSPIEIGLLIAAISIKNKEETKPSETKA